jgi:hypothetical protein
VPQTPDTNTSTQSQGLITDSSLGDRDPPSSRTLPEIKGVGGKLGDCAYATEEKGEESGHEASAIQGRGGVGGGLGGFGGGGEKRGGGASGGVTDLKKVRQQVVFAGVGLETHADGLSSESEARTWVNPYSFHIGEREKKNPSD